MKQMNSTRTSGFTLVELLIVVALIGLLVSITIPVAGSIMESARRNAARVDMNLIANAVEAYYADYRQLPPGVPTNPPNAVIGVRDFAAARQVLDALQGNNPRQKVYLQPQSGTPAPYYLDPWSTNRNSPDDAGNLLYEMRFRRAESLVFPFWRGTQSRNATFRDRRVVLFSYGRDRKTRADNGVVADMRDDVYSFDHTAY